MERVMMDETMSNLTSASGGEVSGSSGSRIEAPPGSIFQYQQSFTSPPVNQPQPTSQKRKRSLPGHPDPDAEVISLSPKSLMAANRFMCEICGKGFQRDQNLQLHRRSHNLPWKLKQRPNKEAVRRKVYVCPESTCVHHDHSRALGDLTGIKKHFSRKHGEKKWKCDKCSKRYAVQSDWKAHSKICGTREYKCDCGTIFSRRDSFITHRAFCDALAEDSARSATTGAVNPLFSSSNHHHLINLPSNLIKREQESHNHNNNNNLHHLLNSRFPSLDHNTPWLGGGGGGGDTSGTTFDPFFHHPQNPNPSRSLPPFHPPQGLLSSPHMSATALLQKAAQMGVTMSKPSSDPSLPSPASVSSSNINNNIIIGEGQRGGGRGGIVAHLPPHHQAHSFSEHNSIIGNPSRGHPDQLLVTNTDHGTAFYDHEEVQRILNPKRPSSGSTFNESGGLGNANDGMTRDFLGLKAFSHGDFFHIPGIDDDQLGESSGTYGKQKTDISTTFWQG